ncbi:RNA polymerase sigma factor FliA [Eleftheria terrae]|uniref:RNA polymerase sigma factor FliA n=1 Tax=Eleftheria terrae TaxID=1597781 RepID=UPI00263BCF1E|nr:RNA polymerase sigma factor FliA [Eleftheria terrae]WKB50946.1 RNA polymerase sigma factor FliA [Eleftheria terrae]
MIATTQTPAQDHAARDASVRQYAPLVRRIAHRLIARLPANVELDDLVQAGMIGLTEALSRSENPEGPQFEAFATQRIRGAMLDELRAGDWISRDARRQHRAAGATQHKLEQQLGRTPLSSEVAREMGIDMAEYHEVLAQARTSQFVSLDEITSPDEEGDSGSAERQFADPEADPLRHVADYRRRVALVHAIETLPERERQALSLYYEHDMSLKEIGTVLGVSDSRVCHLHNQAFQRLRVKLRDW